MYNMYTKVRKCAQKHKIKLKNLKRDMPSGIKNKGEEK